MTDDEFFLRTIDELGERLLAADEYSLLRGTAVLRQLLLDSYPLADRVNESRKLKIRFKVCGRRYREAVFEDAPVFYSSIGGIHQSGPFGNDSEDLSRDAFLGTVVLLVGGTKLTIRDLIGYAANVAGGVHRGLPRDEQQRLLAEFRGAIAFGQPVQVAQLSSVIRIVLDAFDPLRRVVASAT